MEFKSRSKLLIKRFDCAVAIELGVAKIFHKLPSELVLYQVSSTEVITQRTVITVVLLVTEEV